MVVMMTLLYVHYSLPYWCVCVCVCVMIHLFVTRATFLYDDFFFFTIITDALPFAMFYMKCWITLVFPFPCVNY